MSEPKLGTRRVLVTGGGSGIGRAVAERLLADGGRVAVTGRRKDKLDELAARHPGRAFALPCDVGDAARREGLLARAQELLGGLDGLVHAAGAIVREPLGRVTDEALASQLAVNLVAPLRLGEQALSVLEPGGGIVLVSSTLALRPVQQSPVYAATKAAMLSISRSLALAGAARGIRCGSVLPGIVATEMTAELPLDALGKLHPLGRLGTTDEVAEAVVQLLGQAWTTGAEWVVDGGLLLRE